jgi:hypothetical protein
MNSPGKPLAPPRLLLGSALLFWGAALGHPLIGLVCALLVEARWWTDLRWEFGDRGYVRAWSLAIVSMALATVWIWFAGSDKTVHLLEVLEWLPLYLLPMILAQQYGMSESMPLNTFSFIARRRMQLDLAAGREAHPIRVNVGYAYFCAVLMASALGRVDRVWFFIGMFLLASLALFFASPAGRTRPLAWGLAMILVGLSGLGVTAGLTGLYALIQGQQFSRGGAAPIASQSRTAIGKVGELKLSNEICWRARGEVPALLRELVFNRYKQGIWVHLPPEGLNRYEDYEDAVLGMEDETGKDFAFRREDLDLDSPGSSLVHLKGATQTRTPLPLPSGSRILSGIEADGVEFNSLGTVVADNPDFGVLDFSARFAEPGTSERPPGDRDLEVPDDELEAIRRACASLGLYGLDHVSIRQRLKDHFLEEFEYTLYAQPQRAARGKLSAFDLARRTDSGPRARNAIGEFLEVTRAGHCEYFATAATLLLREAGLPARYCVGFSAQEHDADRDEWILRGRHAHAWCRVYAGGTVEDRVAEDGTTARVWTGGRWVDFDPTPPSWLAVEGTALPWQQKFLDWFQRLREDFLLWRTRPGNVTRVSWGIGAMGGLVLVYVGLRLWFSRRRTGMIAGRRKDKRWPDGARTPLHGVAERATKWLGPRPEGDPQTRWLMTLAEMLPDLEEDLREAVRLHWRARFDPLGLEESEEERLRETCRGIQRLMKQAEPARVGD